MQFESIVSAGAMGVSVFLIYKVYALLQKEQEEKTPRTDILKSIYVFMGFAIAMTLLAIGIEVVRAQIGSGSADANFEASKEFKQLKEALTQLQEEELYSLSDKGVSREKTLTIGGEDFRLVGRLEENTLEQVRLRFEVAGDKLKVQNAERKTLGYLVVDDLLKIEDLQGLQSRRGVQVNNEDLLSSGIMRVDLNNSDFRVQKDVGLGIDYLFEVAKSDDNDKTLYDKALLSLLDGKVLHEMTVPELLDLEREVRAKRKVPWRHYELSEIYFELHAHTDYNATAERISYVRKRKQQLEAFVASFEDSRYREALDRDIERGWLVKANEYLPELEKVIARHEQDSLRLLVNQ